MFYACTFPLSPSFCFFLTHTFYIILSVSLSFLHFSFKATGPADLVLLIDGSESVGAANFPLISDLAVQVVEGLAVGIDAIRVALVLYGDDPEIQFYLNSYDNKESVLSAIRGLKYPGGSEANLGAALELVPDSLLGRDAGGRAEEGVPQALVVISAGESTDDVSQGERALKQANVYTFGIAAGDSATAQLEAIATEKKLCSVRS